MSNDPNAFLLGGGGKSAKFETPGDTISGVICAEPEMRQQTDPKDNRPKFWDNGDPQMQLVVRLQTDLRDDAEDDGVRAIYIKGGFKAPTMQKAVADAVRGAGANGLAVGGTLTVQFTGTGPAQKGLSAPKYYAARYVPPTAGSGFLNEPTTTAPVQQQPPNAWANQQAPYPTPPAPAPMQAPAAAVPQTAQTPPAQQLVTMPDGSQVTPEIAALLGQLQQNQQQSQPA